MQEWCSGPDGDKRGHPLVAASATWRVPGEALIPHWIVELHGAHRWQALVRRRRKIVPHAAGDGVAGHGAANLGLEEGDWDTGIRRQIVVLEKIPVHDDLGHLLLKI